MNHLSLIDPAQQRGETWSPFPDWYLPAVDPDSIRPGVDRVRVWQIRREGVDYCRYSGLGYGERCLYIGHQVGMAIVQPDLIHGPWLVDPVFLDEEAPVRCPTVDYLAFDDGWSQGRLETVKKPPDRDYGHGDDAEFLRARPGQRVRRHR